MQLNLNLQLEQEKDKELATAQRVKEATAKKKASKYEPSWEEVWVTGYPTATGKHKSGIFQTKITQLDKDRLIAVKGAIESGELTAGVESLSKFTKTKALALYQELKLLRRDSIIDEMIKNKPANYYCITTLEQLQELNQELVGETIIGLDTETTGLNPFGADYIVGLSLTLPKIDKHYYIPIRHNNEPNQLSPEVVWSRLKSWLESESLKKVLHNAKFDSHMFYREGIDLQGIKCDTMNAMHLLNENEPSYALKNLATKYGKFFGFEDKSSTYEELFGKGGFENTPLDIGHIYACKDTHLTYKFYCWIQEQFERLPQLGELYYNIELPILNVSIDMERAGFLLDTDFAESYKKELAGEIQELREKVMAGFGDININSNQQLGEVIYKQWGVADDFKGKVDAQTLKSIYSQYKNDIPEVEAINHLLEYKKLEKLLGTYIEPLPNKIGNDGRLHGSFNQTATVTGRFASNNPNLQNIPYAGRKMFIAPKDSIIIGIDFS